MNTCHFGSINFTAVIPNDESGSISTTDVLHRTLKKRSMCRHELAQFNY